LTQGREPKARVFIGREILCTPNMVSNVHIRKERKKTYLMLIRNNFAYELCCLEAHFKKQTY